METRNPNRSPAPEGSHGTRSSPESFSAGSSQSSLTELCTTYDTLPLLMAGLVTMSTSIPRPTQQYPTTTTMTLSPLRATRTNLVAVKSLIARFVFVRLEVLLSAGDGSSYWTRSVSGQYPSSTISTSRTVSRTTGSQGNKRLTFWRWRMTSFSGVSQRSRHLLRDLAAVRSSLSNCWI